MCGISLDYATIRGGPQRGLQALVNLGQQEIMLQRCNSMPLGAAWAYYIKVLVLASTAS